MSSVSFFPQDASAYLKDILQSRRDHQDDRIEDGLQSGTLSDKDKDRLGKLQDKTDTLIDKALKDGTVSRDEYTRLMKALDDQNKAIDSLLGPSNTSKSSKAGSRAMDNQEQVLSVLYGRLDRIEKAIKTGTDSGKLDSGEQLKLNASLTKTRDLLDKAMEDGTVSRDELSAISKSQNVLNRDVTTYTRNRRYARASAGTDKLVHITA